MESVSSQNLEYLLASADRTEPFALALIAKVDTIPVLIAKDVLFFGFHNSFCNMMNNAKEFTRAFGQKKVSEWMIRSLECFFAEDLKCVPRRSDLKRADFSFKDFNSCLKLFPFMTDAHQRLLVENLKTTYPHRSQLISLVEIKKLD